jgi:hypothetical protein
VAAAFFSSLLIPAAGLVFGGGAGAATGGLLGGVVGGVAGLANPLAPIIGGIPGAIAGALTGGAIGIPIGAVIGALGTGFLGWGAGAIINGTIGLLAGAAIGSLVTDVIGGILGGIVGFFPGAFLGALVGVGVSLVLPVVAGIIGATLLTASIIGVTAVAAVSLMAGAVVVAAVLTFLPAAVIGVLVGLAVWSIPGSILAIASFLVGVPTLIAGFIAFLGAAATAIAGAGTAVSGAATVVGGSVAGVSAALTAAGVPTVVISVVAAVITAVGGALGVVAAALTAIAGVATLAAGVISVAAAFLATFGAAVLGTSAILQVIFTGASIIMALGAFVIVWIMLTAIFSGVVVIGIGCIGALILVVALLAWPVEVVVLTVVTFLLSVFVGIPLIALAGGVIGATIGSGVGILLALPFKLATVPLGAGIGAVLGIANPINFVFGFITAIPGAIFGALVGPWIFGPTAAVLGFFGGDFLVRLIGALALGTVGALGVGFIGAVIGAGAGVIASSPLWLLTFIAALIVRMTRHNPDTVRKNPELANMLDAAATFGPPGAMIGWILGMLVGAGAAFITPTNIFAAIPAAILGVVIGGSSGGLLGGVVGALSGAFFTWLGLSTISGTLGAALGLILGVLAAFPASAFAGSLVGALIGSAGAWILSSVIPLILGPGLFVILVFMKTEYFYFLVDLDDISYPGTLNSPTFPSTERLTEIFGNYYRAISGLPVDTEKDDDCWRNFHYFAISDPEYIDAISGLFKDSWDCLVTSLFTEAQDATNHFLEHFNEADIVFWDEIAPTLNNPNEQTIPDRWMKDCPIVAPSESGHTQWKIVDGKHRITALRVVAPRNQSVKVLCRQPLTSDLVADVPTSSQDQ